MDGERNPQTKRTLFGLDAIDPHSLPAIHDAIKDEDERVMFIPQYYDTFLRKRPIIQEYDASDAPYSLKVVYYLEARVTAAINQLLTGNYEGFHQNRGLVTSFLGLPADADRDTILYTDDRRHLYMGTLVLADKARQTIEEYQQAESEALRQAEAEPSLSPAEIAQIIAWAEEMEDPSPFHGLHLDTNDL